MDFSACNQECDRNLLLFYNSKWWERRKHIRLERNPQEEIQEATVLKTEKKKKCDLGNEERLINSKIANKQLTSTCPLTGTVNVLLNFNHQRLKGHQSLWVEKWLYASHPGRRIKKYDNSWDPILLKAYPFDSKPCKKCHEDGIRHNLRPQHFICEVKENCFKKNQCPNLITYIWYLVI